VPPPSQTSASTNEVDTSSAARPASRSLRLQTFRALRHRNFALFFSGQFISLIGTWMQSIAQGWLVLELTHRAFQLGLVSAIGSIPVLLLSLPAGVLADRLDKRKVLVLTQTCSMALALLLGSLTLAGIVRVEHVWIIALLSGTVNALDAPTRQAFVAEMVEREDLMNAISLNSAMFNGARIVGPAIAGALIGLVGEGWCFILNGISFVAVITGLLLMRVRWKPPAAAPQHPLHDLLEVARYLKGVRPLQIQFALVAVSSIFGMSYTVLMPVIVKDVFHAGPRELGALMTASGAGALCAALILSSLPEARDRARLLFLGALGYPLVLIAFGFARHVAPALALLFAVGMFMITFSATSNTMVQSTVPDHLRGRVMSIYTLIFLGFFPLGSLQAGAIAGWTSAPFAIRCGALVCLVTAVVTAVLYFRTRDALRDGGVEPQMNADGRR